MVVAQAESKLMTGEELLDMGDVGPPELVEGVLVPMSPDARRTRNLGSNANNRPVFICSQHRLGWVLSGEVGSIHSAGPPTPSAL